MKTKDKKTEKGLPRMPKIKKPILTIELDDNILKIVHGNASAKGWVVDKFGFENISGKSDEDVTKLIKDILHKLKIKKTYTILVIPRSLVTVRYLALPTANSNELKSMIDIQAVRQIPYTKEEMIYDYHIIGLTEEGYTKVLLVIAHRDIITRYLKILENAGISPDSVELDTLSLVELCKFLKITEESPIAVLDIDYATTNIVVLQKDIPTFSRAVSIGATHLHGKTQPTAGKDWIGEWVGEINRSLTVFQRDQAVPITKIVLLSSNGSDIISLVKDKLNFPFSSFNLRSYIQGIPETASLNIGEAEVAVASLLGAIKEGVNCLVNLIPAEKRLFRIKKEKQKSLLVTGLLLLGIIGTLGFTLDKKIQDRKKYLSLLEKQLKETSPQANELALKKERLELIKKQLSTSGTSLDILRELYNIIPQKTALSLFVYDDTQGVTIKGTSTAMSDVFDLIPKLEKSLYFENVKNRYARQQKLRGQELTEFQIDCSITTAPKGE